MDAGGFLSSSGTPDSQGSDQRHLQAFGQQYSPEQRVRSPSRLDRRTGAPARSRRAFHSSSEATVVTRMASTRRALPRKSCRMGPLPALELPPAGETSSWWRRRRWGRPAAPRRTARCRPTSAPMRCAVKPQPPVASECGPRDSRPARTWHDALRASAWPRRAGAANPHQSPTSFVDVAPHRPAMYFCRCVGSVISWVPLASRT